MKAWRLVVPFAAVALLLLVATARPVPAFAAATLPGSPSDCRDQATLAAGAHRAGLVVTFGDRSSLLFCIEFAEDSISGLELIKRSGLPLLLSASGGVCSIDGEGSSDPTDCFAFCKGGGSCQYWAYYQWSDGAWRYSPVGSGARTVRDGDIDAWAWGPGGLSSGAVPAQPGDICPRPTATPATSPPTPTLTPEPAATSVSEPTPITTASAPIPTTAAAIATPTPSPSSATSPVSEAGGVARTPVPSTATASPTAVAPSPSATPQSGAVIVGAREGERNAGRSQRPATRTNTSARKALIGFGGVAGALAGLAGLVWYRRRQAVD